MPVRPGTSAIPEPHPLTATPPPAADLRFSCSVWGSDAEFESVSARRTPRIGDTLFGFKLVAELGRGAFARVYLAQQEALANRSVALKITLRPTREAERLARLQHTNVVPVYSVHDEGSMQVICMPYLGRVTLADLLRAYRADQPSRQAGRKSTSARAARTTELNSKGKSNPKSDGQSGPSRAPTWTWEAETSPPIVGDPVAVLQALAQLADGLTHAHERGILHLDIKPANILLADTGEPMLLDFNLSFDAASPARELVGGTMPYMAIEQLRDMRDRGKGAVDARTDIYALGVVAFELLTGTVLFPTSSKGMRDIEGLIETRRKELPSIRKLNPEVTPAVEAIVRKMLAPEPADRYKNAAELRTDIERHLNDLPLKYAREASLRERFGKWRRRNPKVYLRVLSACFIGLALGLGGVAHLRAEANARYEAVKQAEGTHAALDSVRLDLILPDDAKARVRGVERATELLAPYGLPGDADWQNRPAVKNLSETERAALAGDLGELMILLAQAKWQEVASRPEAERRELAAEAWKLNAAARTCFAEGAAPLMLDRQAALIAPAAGEEFQVVADAPREPTGTRDQFLEGVYLLAQGRYTTAEPFFDRVRTAQPSHAAAQFCLAYCRQQQGQYVEATIRYDAARVLLPNDPRAAYQRGLVYTLTRKPAKAEVEFTKAIALDPTHAEAYRNRAMARYRMGVNLLQEVDGKKKAEVKFAEAEEDLTAALERGARPLFVHYVRAHVRDARNDRAGAAADREAVKNVTLQTEGDYLVRGWTRMDTDPRGAVEDFKKAAERNPRSLIALQNMAHVFSEKLKDNNAALEVATRVAELYPEFAPARSGRAVLLARAGKREEAHREIAEARLLSDDPEITYQAASVYALTSATHKDEDQPRALKLLHQAFQDGYRDVKTLMTDGDLKPLAGNSEFEDIRRSAATLYR